MERPGTVKVETNRLILRPFSYSDIEPMFRNWASDPEVTKYVTWFAHSSTDVTREFVESCIVQYNSPMYFNWAIELKESCEPIGSIGVVKISEDFKVAEIGYCIGRAYWNQRYTSEALYSLIEYLFCKTTFEVIEARHDIRNPNSGKVMHHCGMKYIGVQQASQLTKEGDPLTYVIYRLAKEDWN